MARMLAALAFLSLSLLANAQERAANKVDGLEIPVSQTVAPDEGFVKLTAKCSGPVKWLVVSGTKVKFDADDEKKSVVISIPPEPGVTINVFAVATSAEGKLTDFAQTTIQVAGKLAVKGDNPVKGTAAAFHLTFIFDLNETPRDVAAIINSKEFNRYISERQGFFRVYDVTNPVIAQKKLNSLVQKNNGAPTMIIQSPDGQVLNEHDLIIPATEKSVIDLLNKFVK